MKMLVVTIALLLSVCTSINFGTQINQELRIGMTNDEVSTALDKLEAGGSPFIKRGVDTVGAPCVQLKNLCNDDPDFYLFMLYREDQYPYNVLKTVNNGTPYRYVDYWSGSSSGQRLSLFFDGNTGLLRGWTNSMAYLGARYMHERLCGKMKLEYGMLVPVEKSAVYAVIGPPARLIDPPEKISRAILENHFWYSAQLSPPTLKETRQWEVYEYALPDGAIRHVFLAYSRAKEKLIACGYDHADEEAERFLREQRTRTP